MKKKIKHRTNGAAGALLDEYEKAIDELILTINELTQDELVLIADHETDDEDCRSIQTILTHLVQSGYTYVIEIRKWLREEIDYRAKETLNSPKEYQLALIKMFNYTEALFINYPDLKLTELDTQRKIKVRWGQTFDIEQLIQHAIVHILRHRRQIEIFRLQYARVKSK
ncbi:MAG: DinB family protein [Flavobacteriales bacterium]